MTRAEHHCYGCEYFTPVRSCAQPESAGFSETFTIAIPEATYGSRCPARHVVNLRPAFGSARQLATEVIRQPSATPGFRDSFVESVEAADLGPTDRSIALSADEVDMYFDPKEPPTDLGDLSDQPDIDWVSDSVFDGTLATVTTATDEAQAATAASSQRSDREPVAPVTRGDDVHGDGCPDDFLNRASNSGASSTVQTLLLTRISVTGNTQSRAALNEETVAEYRDAMLEGAQFPPLVVFADGGAVWLASGFHRYFAAKAAGRETIECEVRSGGRREAILFSVGENATHGLRRTNADKRKAVEMLLDDHEWAQWSDREIARRCAVSDKTVASLRKSAVSGRDDGKRTFTTKYGTEAVMHTSGINAHREGSKVAVESHPLVELGLPEAPPPALTPAAQIVAQESGPLTVIALQAATPAESGNVATLAGPQPTVATTMPAPAPGLVTITTPPFPAPATLDPDAPAATDRAGPVSHAEVGAAPESAVSSEGPGTPDPAQLDLDSAGVDQEQFLREYEHTLAELDRVQAIVEADEPLKAAMARIKQLEAENALLTARIHGLMNEKNAAIRAAQAARRAMKKAGVAA